MNYFNLICIIALLSSVMSFCNNNNRLDIKYTNPYYAVNLVDQTPVYVKPDDSIYPIYYIENNRIVKMTASISMKNSKEIWYYIKEPDFKGYAKMNNFKLFDDQKKAGLFMLDKHPSKKGIPELSIYLQGKSAYEKGDYENSINKLLQLITLRKPLKQSYPIIYYSTSILIAKIYIKMKEYQRAISHLKELLSQTPKEITLPGSYFNPNKISFNIKEINKYLKKSNFKNRIVPLKWEVYYYLGLANELLGKKHRAKTFYLDILLDKNIKKTKITYINYSIDRIALLEDKITKINALEKLKIKLDWNNHARYILFKIANTLNNNRKAKYNIKLALTYYKEFIGLFETKFRSERYPGETKHYLTAKEQVKLLSKTLSLKQIEKNTNILKTNNKPKKPININPYKKPLNKPYFAKKNKTKKTNSKRKQTTKQKDVEIVVEVIGKESNKKK